MGIEVWGADVESPHLPGVAARALLLVDLIKPGILLQEKVKLKI